MQFTLSDRGTVCRHIDKASAAPLPAADAAALEDLDLIYRTLCAVLYNFVPMSGHPGGSISSGRIVASLLFRTLDYDFSNPDDPSADLITYAAGHKAMGLYAMWACRNEIVRFTKPALLPATPNQLRLEDLLGFRKNRTTRTPLFLRHNPKPLDGHPTPLVPFVPLSTGASGVGFASSVGLAFALRDLYPEKSPLVHALEGEGGLTPGRVHEAIACAASAGLSNFVCHVDWNQASIDTNLVCREGATPGDYVQWNPAELFMVHGFNVITVEDGKDFAQVLAAQQELDALQDHHPTAIVYRTVKGWQYGIEGKKSHGAGHGFCAEEYYRALEPFEARFGISFPRFEGDKSETRVEECFYESLLTVRSALERHRTSTALLGAWVAARRDALRAAARTQRTNAPSLAALYEKDISPLQRPAECTYATGTAYTLRAALADALKYLNQKTGGAFIASAADLYGSTSISSAAAGFAEGFYHSGRNPASRLLAVGGIAEDAMGGIIAGISTMGHHIGVGSSYGAFIAPLHMISARLHAIGLQARHERNPGLRSDPFISINAHAGVKTGEDGPTHAEPNSLQIFQENFPGQMVITLTPWEPLELWPLIVAAIQKRPAVIAPFVTRPNETVLDRAALGLAPAEASIDGIYKLLAANGKPDASIIYQGSEVAYAFVQDVLPRLKDKGINLDVYYVASAELFSALPQARRDAIYPASVAETAMAITGFTMPTMYRWVTSARGREHSLHPFRGGAYLGSGAAHKVMEEAGLDGEAQYTSILRYLER